MKSNKVHTCYGCPQYFVDRNEYRHGLILPTRHCDIEDKWKCDRFNGKSENCQMEKEEKE